MVVWNRDLTYKNRLTSEEREDIARSVATPGTIRRAEKINNLINIWLPVIIFWLTDFNLIALTIAFVATDIILCTYDHLRFIIIPHFVTMNMSLSDVQKRIEKMTQQRDELSRDIKEYYDEHCRHNKCPRNCNYCALTYMEKDRDRLTTFINSEQKHVDTELSKIKEAEMQADTKKSKDYTDKKDYLIQTRDKLHYFKTKHDMKFLDSIYDSVFRLIDVLEKKPFGYEMVPNKIYIHIDELQNILTQMAGFDNEQRSRYEQDVNKIANALSQDVERLVERVSKSETESVEVSIAVLMKELVDEGEMKNV
jgi:hypothetical protein